MDLLQYFNQQQVQATNRPELRAGDIVRVETKITEGEKTRLQAFEGTVLGIRGAGPSKTFTVRRITAGFGVERIFPLYSPLITGIEVVKRQKVRRAKLTYLRKPARRRVKEDIAAMERLTQAEAEKEAESVKAQATAERKTEEKVE